MNGIILFKSKYGATRKYAGWLSEETGFPAMETSKADIRDVMQYDVIILGGGIYASGIAGLPFLNKNRDALKDKKIIVFCVGASPYAEGIGQAMLERNLKEGARGIPCFYCRGAWDMAAMTMVDRSLCRLLRKTVAKKDPATYEEWEKALMAAGQDACDWTDKAYLAPLLAVLGRVDRAE